MSDIMLYSAFFLSILSVFFAFFTWYNYNRILVAVKRAFSEKALMLHAKRKSPEVTKQLIKQILAEIHPLGALASPFVDNIVDSLNLKPSDIIAIVDNLPKILGLFSKKQSLQSNVEQTENLNQNLQNKYIKGRGYNIPPEKGR